MLTAFLFLFLAVGGIFIGLSVPLIQGRIPPNPWYGFRVPSTLRDPELWYPANVYAAWRLLWLGIATALVAVAAYFVPHLDLASYATIVLAAMLIGLAFTVVQSFRYLAVLKRDKAQASSGDTNL